MSPEALYEHATRILKNSSASGWAELGTVINAVKGLPDLRWANPYEIKTTVEELFTKEFGTKEALKPKRKVGHST